MEDLTKKIEDLKVSDSEKTSNEPPKNNTKEENDPTISSPIINPEILNNDKIYIIFSGSDLLWYKTKKSIESDIKFDFLFQKSKYIYFNKKFIKEFYKRILKHPRCVPGFISSMNINNCQSLIQEMYKSCGIKKEEQIKDLIYLGKKCHDMVNTKKYNPDTTTEFKRNMGNMAYCINKHFHTINEFYKMLIIESDPDKMSDSTKPYSIVCPIFNEDYIIKKEIREEIDLKGENLIQFLEKLLNNCTENINSYLKEKNFEL